MKGKWKTRLLSRAPPGSASCPHPGPRRANWFPPLCPALEDPHHSSARPTPPSSLPSWHLATSFRARVISKYLHLRNCEIKRNSCLCSSRGLVQGQASATQFCIAGDRGKRLWGFPGRLPGRRRRFPVIHYSWKDRRAQDESRRDPSCVKIKMIFLAILYNCKVSPRGAWEKLPGHLCGRSGRAGLGGGKCRALPFSQPVSLVR